MLRPFLWATLAVTTVFASGEFVVLHSPKNVEFSGNEQIDHSVLKDVFKALLGFTIKPGSWTGIRTNAPFDLPKAVVVVAIEGAEHLESHNGKVYRLNDSEVEEITWQAVSGILQGRGKDNVLVRMRMADGLDALGESALGTLKPNPIDESTLQSLKLENDKDRKILEEIKLLDAIARNVPSEIAVNGKPDVYWLVVSGMRPLIELHCNDSPAVKEALVLLNDALSNVTKAFMTAYKDQVVITAFTNGTSTECNSRTGNLSRQRRAEPMAAKDLNLAKRYSGNYPVIFNIFLWFGVAFFFSLLAVCITIADMDPGRDSIIYRMTSTRMKKDN